MDMIEASRVMPVVRTLLLKNKYAREIEESLWASVVDAAPVVHGRWQLNKDGSGTCDQCHFTQKNVWDIDNWQNFCGVCGADMRSK